MQSSLIKVLTLGSQRSHFHIQTIFAWWTRRKVYFSLQFLWVFQYHRITTNFQSHVSFRCMYSMDCWDNDERKAKSDGKKISQFPLIPVWLYNIQCTLNIASDMRRQRWRKKQKIWNSEISTSKDEKVESKHLIKGSVTIWKK